MAKPILPKSLTSRGYTLIEILIVLFIISIVTSVALLSIGHNENKQLKALANELTQVISLAEEQAILQPAVIGISLTENVLQFQVYLAEPDKKTWLPLDDTILGKRNLPADSQVSIEVAGRSSEAAEDQSNQPQIIISTNGDITPFVLYVGKKGQAPRYKVIGESDGTISSQSIS